MKNSKKGISLIVLIITIIVIIILATAILVSVINNNPISEANKARYESDRDNMQAVFTNTVGKIMAENQGVVNVTAGQINTETADVTETTGEVAYTVDNAANEANASGTIKFDKGTNDATTYYTGKKLPIYAAGETKWYVDSEGVMSVEVAGVKYGSGEVENGSDAEEEILEAGAYDENGILLADWQKLIDDGYVTERAILDGAFGQVMFDENGEQIQDAFDAYKLIIPNTVIQIETYAFEGAWKMEIYIPDSVTNIESGAFYSVSEFKIYYEGTEEKFKNLLSENDLSQLENQQIFYNYKLDIWNTGDIKQEGGFYYVDGTYKDWETLSSEGFVEYNADDNGYWIISDGYIGSQKVDIEKVVIDDEIIGFYSTDTFSSCDKLKEVIIQSPNITYLNLGEYAYCSSLKSIHIPSNVTSISSCVFEECTNLTTIVYGGTTSQWKEVNLSSDFNINCPEITVYCINGNIVIPAWTE